MKKNIVFSFFLCFAFYGNAQVVLATDYTNATYNKGELKNIWNVANRISPTSGAGVRTGLEVNTIRMIGGINKKVNGVNQPDLAFDPVNYDANTGNYIYNWTVLKNRINAVRRDTKIFQLVLDQVPWAFQQGYAFIPTGTRDNVNFREDERVTHYGNSLPPKDKVAYFNFIKALMTELVATYGETEVLSWRFRVGSEIETPDHWKGTQQDFIDHFANTVKAVREVLPNAVIGLHTREPDFVYKNGTVLNYKGEPIKSFAAAIIDYCYANNIKYDFWGASEYVLINNGTDRDITQKYTKLFAPLINNPKWNPNATIDMMEYSVVTTMDGADGAGYITCETPHSEVVNLAYSNTFYQNEEKGLRNFFRWGQRPNTIDPPSIEVLNTMVGRNRFKTTVSGAPAISTNQLDAIFSQNSTADEMDVIVYNMNSNSLNYQNPETIKISFTCSLPVGTVLKYRNMEYGKDQNELENFLKNEPTSGWIKSGYDRKGAPSRTLNTEGVTAYASFINPNPYLYNSWTLVTTTARTDGKSGSLVTISTTLPSFAFKKYEFRLNGTIAADLDFVKPITNTIIQPNARIEVEASSNIPASEIANVELFINNISVRKITQAPFKWGYSGQMDVLLENKSVGDYILKLVLTTTNGQTSEATTVVKCQNALILPYGGVAHTIPGKIEIEDYDTGGQDLAYNDTTFGNDTSGYRSEKDVDLALGGTGYVSTSIAGGEYTRYTIHVTEAGIYHMDINFKTAASSTRPVAAAILKSDLTSSTSLFSVTGSSSGIINTNGNYVDWSTPSFNLQEGTWVLEFQIPSGGAGPNYDYFTLVKEVDLSVNLFDKTKDEIIVYPNPSNEGVFYLKTDSKWVVYDLTGVKIASGAGKIIDISKFSKGNYIVKTGNSSKMVIYN